MDLPLSVLSQVTAILDQQNIPYVLVGSFASSIHGIYRSTADIDILADIHPDQLGTSRSSLDAEYLSIWAKKLGVVDLLQRALDDVQEESDL
jgi:predicted nucleotidyltransferase